MAIQSISKFEIQRFLPSEQLSLLIGDCPADTLPRPDSPMDRSFSVRSHFGWLPVWEET